LTLIAIDGRSSGNRPYVTVFDRLEPLRPPYQTCCHGGHHVPGIIHELINLYVTGHVSTYSHVVERIRPARSIAALADTIEMVDSNGEDPVAIKKRAGDFEPAPRPLPRIAPGQYARSRRADDIFAD